MPEPHELTGTPAVTWWSAAACAQGGVRGRSWGPVPRPYGQV